MATARKLIPFAEFARLAGVSRAAVTQAADKSLQPAVVGTRIDIEHPSAKDYVESQYEPTLYEEAIYLVSSTQSATVRGLIKELHIPQREAQAILKQMEAAGAISTPPGGVGKSRTVFIKDVPKPKGRRGPAPAPPAPTKESKPPSIVKEHDLPSYTPDQDLGFLREMTIGKLLEMFGTSERLKTWLSVAKTLEDIEGRQVKNAKSKGELISRDLVRTHIFGMIDDSHKRLLTDEPRALARRLSGLAKSGASLEEMEQAIRDSMSKQLRNVKATATRVLKK